MNNRENRLNEGELQNVSSRFESISSYDWKKCWFIQFGHCTGDSRCIVVSRAIGNRLPSQVFRWSAWVLTPLTEVHSAVHVLIGMYSRQLLEGRGTFTAHADVVHMGKFGSVRTLCGCVYVPCLLRVPWWQSFIQYLMEVLSGFPLSSHLFLNHLVIGFLYKGYTFLFLSFKSKYIW